MYAYTYAFMRPHICISIYACSYIRVHIYNYLFIYCYMLNIFYLIKKNEAYNYLRKSVNFALISSCIIDKLYSITDKGVIKSWIISCASAHI